MVAYSWLKASVCGGQPAAPSVAGGGGGARSRSWGGRSEGGRRAARHSGEQGEGLHHIALWSDDVDADVARLREQGAPVEDEQPRDGVTGRLSYLRPEAFDGVTL